MRDDAVAVSISDDGPGIDPADQDAIFEKFRQARASGPQPGSGLGLAIARRIARTHGGTLTVDSSPGEGATFTVSVPRVDSRSEPVASASQNATQ
jgi:signal transduction histidine kinase